MKRLGVAVVERAVAPAPEQGLGALRGALVNAGAAAREEVALDFLDDDLHEAEAALAEVRDYVEEVAAALRRTGAGRRDLMVLARARGADERLDDLHVTLAGLRRRLAQVAARLPG